MGDLDSLAYRDPGGNAAVDSLEGTDTQESANDRFDLGRFVQMPIDKLIETAPGCSDPQGESQRESLVTMVKRRTGGELAQDLADKQPLGFSANERANGKDTGGRSRRSANPSH